MTELLYLKDPYLNEMDASVIESSGDYVVLDKTVFYPSGGGQSNDLGTLNNVKVLDVIKKDGKVKHVLQENPFKVGDKVKGSVDWERRYQHMRMHTSQHILSALILDKYGAETVGNQIGLEESRMDFRPFKPDHNDLIYLNDAFNEIVNKKIPVNIHFMSREKVIQDIDPKRRNLFSRVPSFIENIRVIEIENFDKCPCGGTHVKNTGEISPINIIGTINKGKGVTRLTFKLK